MITLPTLTPGPNSTVVARMANCVAPVAVVLTGPKAQLKRHEQDALRRMLIAAPRFRHVLARIAEAVTHEGEIVDAGQLDSALTEARALLTSVGVRHQGASA